MITSKHGLVEFKLPGRTDTLVLAEFAHAKLENKDKQIQELEDELNATNMYLDGVEEELELSYIAQNVDEDEDDLDESVSADTDDTGDWDFLDWSITDLHNELNYAYDRIVELEHRNEALNSEIENIDEVSRATPESLVCVNGTCRTSGIYRGRYTTCRGTQGPFGPTGAA